MLDQFMSDVRHSLRTLRKRPAFATTAILAFGLGTGANTAIFSLIRAALIEPPPFHDPNRIVTLWEESSRRPGQHNVVSPANYLRWVERATSFERVAAYVDARANLNDTTVTEEVVVQRVTPEFFPIFGVSPIVGRTFTDRESHDPQASVVVLVYDLWQRRFGADPHVVGRTIQFNAVPTTIVGVMPPGFKLYLRSGGLAGKPAE